MANKHEKQKDFYKRMREWRNGTQLSNNNTISGWRNGTQSSNNNTINGKVLVRFDYELDSNGPKSYYDNKDKECFKRPETMDPEL